MCNFSCIPVAPTFFPILSHFCILGNFVNRSKFTTTDSFLEGAGAKHPAGTNVVVVKSGEEFKYDVLAGFVDLSGYPTNETFEEGLAGCVKTADLEAVTEAEILALFAEE